MKEKDIAGFYDEFIGQQKNSGINERIYALYKRMSKLGLEPGSKVLELGCGIGTITYMLSRKIKTGLIEAVDISPKSIEFAKQRLQKKNIIFNAGNAINYTPVSNAFDFITLFDIIEHIPLENHEQLFRNISGICSDNTLILINIPSPGSVEYDRRHQPHVLQVIDQPVYLQSLVENLVKNELELVFFERYSIWNENDYHFFIARKKLPFKEISLAGKRNLLKKALKKAERTLIKRVYNYPR
jgi:ubiquinone/menaquinone biosynthesis C-methylase UbiE